ncbi:MAG: hypothetical protein WC587_00395 [Candidatus Paceibacterota bacterium]
MIKRIIADVIFFSCLFILPWQWTAVLAVVFIILFGNFWEAALAGLIFDSLYSIPGAKIYGRFGIFTATALVLVLVSKIIRKKIRLFS